MYHPLYKDPTTFEGRTLDWYYTLKGSTPLKELCHAITEHWSLEGIFGVEHWWKGFQEELESSMGGLHG